MIDDGQVVLYGFIVHGMCCEAGLAEGGQVFFWDYIGGRVWNLRIYDFCFYLSAWRFVIGALIM